MLVAVAGTKGAVGVTTLAYALARHWSSVGSAVFVEADPDGGAVAARLGLSQDPGLAALAAGVRREVEPSALARQIQRPPGGPAVLVLPSAPGHARAVLRTVAEGLTTSADLAILGAPGPGLPPATGRPGSVVADVGRLSGESPALPLVVAAARLVVVTTTTLEGADAAAVRIAEVGDVRGRVGLVTVGDGPYRGEELARVLAVAHLGHLPDSSSWIGSVWAGGSRPRRWRGPYARAVSSMAVRLDDRERGALDLTGQEPSTISSARLAGAQAEAL